MQNLKKIFFVLLALLFVYQSFKFINSILEIKEKSWLLAFIFGCILNLMITGISAFLGFALPTQKLLPDSYYQIKNVKLLKSAYNIFQVELFRLFLLATFWKKKKQQKNYFNGRLDGIAHFKTQTKKSEFGHLIPLIALTILCVFLVIKDFKKLALVTFIINIFFNGYPILLQRHHRMRLLRFETVLERRKQRKVV